MNYLDYLLTHSYDELPAAVRREIVEQDYTSRRKIVLGLRNHPAGLTPELRQAFGRARAQRPRPRRWTYWMAASGWVLAITIFVLSLNRQPRAEYVARVSPPVVERDTVEVVARDTLERVVYRDRLLRDTFFAPAPAYVVVHDTIYRLPGEPYPTGSVGVDPAGLSLLVGSRGD